MAFAFREGPAGFRGGWMGALGLVALTVAACATAPDGGGSDTRLQAACERAETLFDNAQYDNFAFNFAAADTALAEVIDLYNDPALALEAQCPADRTPARTFVLASRALALSNQEQFLLAERLLDQADAALAEDAPVDQQVLLLNFRAMHARNLEQSSRASDADRARIRGFLSDSRTLLASSEARTALAPGLEGVGADIVGIDRSGIRQLIGAAALDYLESGLAANQGDYARAESLIERAIRRIDRRQGIGEGYLPRFLVQKATIQLEVASATADPGLRAARYAAARDTATTAVERIKTLFDNTPIAARALMIRAKAEERANDPDAALATYGEAFAIYQENPSAVAYESVWPFLSLSLAQRTATTDPARRAALDRGMFEAAQIVRSSTVANAIATSTAAARASEAGSPVAALVAENQAAEDAFRQLTVRSVIAQGGTLTLEDQTTLDRRLTEARERLRQSRVALGLEGNAPVAGAEEYLALLNKPVTLDAVQASLEGDEALVQVLTGEPRGTVFVIGRDRLDVFQTDRQDATLRLAGGEKGASTPENYVNSLLESVRVIGERLAATGTAPRVPFNVITAHTAYKEFLGKAQPALDRYGKLIFAVSGPLAALPMEMLVTEKVDTKDPAFLQNLRDGNYSGVAWLADQKAISYVPSPRNFVDLRGSAAVAAADEPLLIFSGYESVPPARREEQTRALLAANGLAATGEQGPGACVDLARAVVGLEGLDEGGANARAIAGTMNAPDSVFTGDRFTPRTLDALGDQLDNYQILHFNTHGILWDSPDCFVEPALAINVDPASAGNSETTDRLLAASEIQQFDLDADLVVLSACETAGGNGLGGESLSGLARSFFIAGARALVASHWNAQEKTTNQLMQALYADLAATPGRSFRDALTTAQGVVRGTPESSHPFFWAPFVLIGDGSSSLGAG